MRDLQKKIVEYEHVLPEIDPKEEIRKTIDFLKGYLKANPFLKSYVLGISGGQDWGRLQVYRCPPAIWRAK